jgi:transcriptional regulator GlxA family with amidase domain
MISRLIDLLVIRTLRTWANARPTNLGWLGGLGEEHIGRALSAMRAAPERGWNVETLANIAAMCAPSSLNGSRLLLASRHCAISRGGAL